MSHDDLKQYAKDNQKYLKMGDGESYVGFFIGHARIPNRFEIAKNPHATTVVYTLRDSTGKVLEWTQGSGKVADEMGKIPHGSGVSITRVKKGDYTIKKLDVSLPTAKAEEEAPF